MNEGMYMGLRAEAQEHNSLLKQILDEQRRTNELLDRAAFPPVLLDTATPVAPPEAVGPVTVETVEVVDTPVEDKPAPKKGKGK